MSCCKATKLRDINYTPEYDEKPKTHRNKVGNWLIFILLLISSPFWGLPMIWMILYRGIIKNEALNFIELTKYLAKNNNKFTDHEILK
jgi:hypothetical protein